MSENKRRKLNRPVDPPKLSAFSARRALQVEQDNRKSAVFVEGENSSTAHPVNSGIIDHELQEVPAEELNPILHQLDSIIPDNASDEDHNNQSSSFPSRAESPEVLLERPSIILSNFIPTKNSIKEVKNGSLSLKLAPGERLVIVGQYDISVQSGQITLLGATLQPSKEKYRIYAPSSHSIPVIRCLGTEVNEAQICLYQCGSGLGSLEALSPLFGKLWNEGLGPLPPQYQSFVKQTKSSFQILFSSNDGPKKAYLQPIISPPEWNEALSRLSTQLGTKIPRVMICGPKSSGKSTFAKLLTNKILSTPANTSKFRSDENKALGVAVLDIDPGQPEYSVPGQLSLIHVYDPNFGPPYSHPIPGSSSRIIRAHSIGATTPSFDPSLYMSCVLDLFDHYRNLLSAIPTCPLIINTPGWVLGTGLEILTDLILKVRPSDIVYMSLEGPMEVVDSLREAAKTTPVSTLPSQVSEYTTRTSAHLRTMQVMSYFHLEQPAKQSISWNSSPLTSVRPWEVLYSGEQAGILGIISYGEQPPADLLLDSINGSLLAVVVVDDPSAIPGLENTGSNGTETDQRQIGTKDLELHVFSDDIQAVQTLTNPLVIRTPKEDIPYFNPENIVSVDPKHSHCIGLALVRGIDIHRRRIQLLTPLDESAIEEVEDAGKKIVLVSGKFDTPGWAFTEDLISKSWMEKAAEKLDDGDRDGGDDKKSYEDTEKGFDDTPWVEIQNGSQGRGVAGRVWRVRRDLGKTGDGG